MDAGFAPGLGPREYPALSQRLGSGPLWEIGGNRLQRGPGNSSGKACHKLRHGKACNSRERRRAQGTGGRQRVRFSRRTPVDGRACDSRVVVPPYVVRTRPNRCRRPRQPDPGPHSGRRPQGHSCFLSPPCRLTAVPFQGMFGLHRVFRFPKDTSCRCRLPGSCRSGPDSADERMRAGDETAPAVRSGSHSGSLRLRFTVQAHASWEPS